MNERHKQRIRQKDERSKIDYWRQRAEKAERELAELKAARGNGVKVVTTFRAN
jgi:hypothetical protein